MYAYFTRWGKGGVRVNQPIITDLRSEVDNIIIAIVRDLCHESRNGQKQSKVKHTHTHTQGRMVMIHVREINNNILYTRNGQIITQYVSYSTTLGVDDVIDVPHAAAPIPLRPGCASSGPHLALRPLLGAAARPPLLPPRTPPATALRSAPAWAAEPPRAAA